MPAEAARPSPFEGRFAATSGVTEQGSSTNGSAIGDHSGAPVQPYSAVIETSPCPGNDLTGGVALPMFPATRRPVLGPYAPENGFLSKASMHLVLVESPAKAKTINKYLGKGYEVLASFGH